MLSPNGFELPDKEFKSDGCSGGLSATWRKLFKVPPPIEACCFDHDIEYHYGSGPDASMLEQYRERFGADWRFFLCSLKRPGVVPKLLAPCVFVAVRFGGAAHWKRPYSWGFGWSQGGN